MFHQPGQSDTTYRLVLSRQTGASTDSRRLPLTSLPLAGTPFSSGATRSSVPSHGIVGWFHHIQASLLPSGDRRGYAKKSEPKTTSRTAPGFSAAEPSSGTATIDRLTLASPWRSCTHQTSLRSGDRTKSA